MVTVERIPLETLDKKAGDVCVLKTIGAGGQWCKLYLISEEGSVWDERVGGWGEQPAGRDERKGHSCLAADAVVRVPGRRGLWHQLGGWSSVFSPGSKMCGRRSANARFWGVIRHGLSGHWLLGPVASTGRGTSAEGGISVIPAIIWRLGFRAQKGLDSNSL